MAEIQFAQWPKNVPRPTDEEYVEAERRYSTTISPNDVSDWPSGLCYVMSTYAIGLWENFFDSLKRRKQNERQRKEKVSKN